MQLIDSINEGLARAEAELEEARQRLAFGWTDTTDYWEKNVAWWSTAWVREALRPIAPKAPMQGGRTYNDPTFREEQRQYCVAYMAFYVSEISWIEATHTDYDGDKEDRIACARRQWNFWRQQLNQQY